MQARAERDRRAIAGGRAGAARGSRPPVRGRELRDVAAGNLARLYLADPAKIESAVDLARTALARIDELLGKLRETAGTKTGDISFANNDPNENPYNFSITDLDAGQTFSFAAGFPSCGTGGALVAGSATIARSASTVAPRGPLNGYHSQFATNADTVKWMTINLEKTGKIDGVRLHPARPYDWQPDTPGFLFPLRFKIDAAQKPDFSDARVLVDRSSSDEPNPGTNSAHYGFPAVDAQFVRLSVTRLRQRDTARINCLSRIGVKRELRNHNGRAAHIQH